MPADPTYPGVYVEEIPAGARTIRGISTSVSAFIGATKMGPLNQAVRVVSFGSFARQFGGLDPQSETSYAVQQYFVNGGREAWIVRVADSECDDGSTLRPAPVNSFLGSREERTGLYALESVDLFNVLCMPDATTLALNEMRSLYTEAENYAEERKAMLIVDIPADVATPDQIQAWLDENEALRHQNAAVFYPRTDVPDPLNPSRPRSIPTSGTIAGLWARIDAQRGVWKAPVGTSARLLNVIGFAHDLTDEESRTLNRLGINCLRNVPVVGNVCWGARTLEGSDGIASDWKYVPVRRTALFIEESLYRGIQWAVFEPNDEPLWLEIRLSVGEFMHNLFKRGVFQGTTPEEAYFVRCDGATTTQQDIDNGVVNIEVGCAPLRPAEFVILRIQQKAGQTQV